MTSLSSLTAMAAPGSRGPEPSVPTTRASATCLPGRAPAGDVVEKLLHLLPPPYDCDFDPRDHLGELLEGVQRMPLHELVNIRERRRHSGRQRSVTR